MMGGDTARAGLAALCALALPTRCAACGQVDEIVCRGCGAEVDRCTWPGGARSVVPTPSPAGFPLTHAAAPYAGALARLVTAYKDDGRRDCAPLLGALLGEALDRSLLAAAGLGCSVEGREGPLLVVPVPSSARARRARGDAPLTQLAHEAVRGRPRGELLVRDALRMRRAVADQAGLTAGARMANLEHAMEVPAGCADGVAGSRCVVVDDVVTTGATLVEARRALLAGGAALVVGAALCATVRRSTHPPAGPHPGP